MSFVSNAFWLSAVLYTRLKPIRKFCKGSKRIERRECITLFTEIASQLSVIYFVLCTVWKCDIEELFEGKLVVSFVFRYSRSRFF